MKIIGEAIKAGIPVEVTFRLQDEWSPGGYEVMDVRIGDASN